MSSEGFSYPPLDLLPWLEAADVELPALEVGAVVVAVPVGVAWVEDAPRVVDAPVVDAPVVVALVVEAAVVEGAVVEAPLVGLPEVGDPAVVAPLVAAGDLLGVADVGVAGVAAIIAVIA